MTKNFSQCPGEYYSEFWEEENNRYKQYLNSKNPTSLYECVADWWDDVFTTHSDLNMEASIESLVKRIIEFLPDVINEPSACDDWDVAWNSGYNAYRQMLLKKINGEYND